jgi:hypothetical protein
MNDGHFSINPELRLRTSKCNKLRSALANARIRMQVERELNLCVQEDCEFMRACNHPSCSCAESRISVRTITETTVTASHYPADTRF